MGWVLSAFFAGYALAMIPVGLAAQRFGPRRVFALSMGGWSLFTLLTPLARGASGLASLRFLLGVGDFLVHWSMWVLGPLERTMLRLDMTPDHMNAAGLGLGALSGLLVGLGHLELGGWAIVLSGVCDILDGRLARTRGVASAYGKFIDSTLDRFVETFVFLGLVAYYRYQPAAAFVAAAGW